MLTTNINPYPNAPEKKTIATSTESLHAHTTHHPSATHIQSKTKSNDLHILAHAQGQLREHLEPSNAHWHRDTQVSSQPYVRDRPWSAHQSAAQTLHFQPTSPRESNPHLRTHVAHLPFRWWENGGVFDIDVDDDAVEEGGVVESIEVDDDISPGTAGTDGSSKLQTEDMDDEEEARIWDEAQRNWNGYVKQKESWVRRAGLKREREREGLGEQQGVRKKGRADG